MIMVPYSVETDVCHFKKDIIATLFMKLGVWLYFALVHSLSSEVIFFAKVEHRHTHKITHFSA